MQHDRPRIIFFGMDSLFSTVLLKALCSADLKPLLVVDGITHPPTKRTPIVRQYSVRPKGWERVMQVLSLRKPHEPKGLISSEANLVRNATELGVDALLTSNANALRVRALIKSLEPELFVVGGFPHLLKSNVLELAQKGGLNVHPGKLPEQRGPAPLFWSLKNGSSELNYTIHVLDEGEDTGDIVAKGRFAFKPGAHGRDLLHKCAQEAAPQIIKAVRSMRFGDLVRSPQSKVGANRCPRPKYRDNLIDVSMTAEQIFSFVSGCVGAYPIFAECGGDRFFIEKAKSYSMTEELPCEFMLSGNILLLRCHPGVVEMTLRPKGGAVFSSEYIEHRKEP